MADASPRGDRALVVGVDEYADPGFRDLRGAARDARNIRWLLTEHLGFDPGQVRMLTDGDANRDLRPVANATDWLLALGERLREPLLGTTGTRRFRWSAARVEYEIVQ